MWASTRLFCRIFLALLLFYAACGHDEECEGRCWKFPQKENRMKYNSSCTITRYPNLTDINGVELVVDPCTNEENRDFMECALHFVNTSEPEEGINAKLDQGNCLCYRDWGADVYRTPVYNHSKHPEIEAHDWFVYDEKLGECVVKDRKKCAPSSVEVTPYRCEKGGQCEALGQDPHYKICIADGANSMLFQDTPSLGLLLAVYGPLSFVGSLIRFPV